MVVVAVVWKLCKRVRSVEPYVKDGGDGGDGARARMCACMHLLCRHKELHCCMSA